MAKIPVGVQLFSVRDDCARDLPGTLAALARMGYQGVEFAGYYNQTAQSLRGMLDRVGLKCCGAHIGLDTLLGDEFAKTVEFNLELGNRYLIVPWLAPERHSGQAAWLETAALFNDIAEKLVIHGLRVGYHNHSEEFAPVKNGSGSGFDTFFGHTHQDVIMQLDIGNALIGGGDPIDCLKRFPRRSTTIHLKEYSAMNDKALLGEGDVPWQQVFDLCESGGGVDWYIVEEESYPLPPLQSVEACLRALKRMGKA